MHKGYAFVQFTNPFDARNACHGEDGRNILSQILGKKSFAGARRRQAKLFQTPLSGTCSFAK